MSFSANDGQNHLKSGLLKSRSFERADLNIKKSNYFNTAILK